VGRECYGELLKNRNFTALWIGQIFSQLADRIIFVVFITLIVSYFGPKGAYKSYLYVAFTIPAILLTAVAGVYVDRWNRRNTLVITNVLRALIMVVIPMAIGSHSLLALYACAFGISAITQFFVPAESATIPMIVRPAQLMLANSLFTTTMMGSVIFGFALGDPLIQWVGLTQVHWAICALFLISALSLCMVHAGAPKSCPVGKSEADEAFHARTVGDFWSELKEGFLYLHHDRVVFRRMVKLSVLFSYVVSMCILFISFAEAFLYASPVIAAQKFVWIITFSGVGMVLGALWVGQGLHHVAKGKLVYSGFILMSISLLGLTVTGQLAQHVFWPQVFPFLDARIAYAHGMAVLLGLGAALVAVPLQSVLHELIPEDRRGKVMGVQFTLISAASTLPAVFAGFGADWLGVVPMLIIMGLPLLLLGGKGLYDRINGSEGLGIDDSTW